MFSYREPTKEESKLYYTKLDRHQREQLRRVIAYKRRGLHEGTEWLKSQGWHWMDALEYTIAFISYSIYMFDLAQAENGIFYIPAVSPPSE